MLIITDNWHPEVNGIVTTLVELIARLKARGASVHVISPLDFPTLNMPFFAEVRLSLVGGKKLAGLIGRASPDGIHLATEGPLGLAGRRYCIKNDLRFSSAMHTHFPDYMQLRFKFPANWGYAYLRWFHGAAAHTLVPTPLVARALKARGFSGVELWTRGVDADLFSPERRCKDRFAEYPGPRFLYVGRLAPEKNVAAFLGASLPGTKLVVGDGPAKSELQSKFGDAKFLGELKGAALADAYAGADCLVFPSRTDTFGIVMLEALATGTPVAAYPVPGPLDVIGNSGAGVLDEDLARAALGALGISRDLCREYALGFSWETVVDEFLEFLPVAKG
ncbi:MAG: glycosyltransferase family 1 protein [Alphaproteobacteria bacterium]|nr:glycosyltransferase family 1 protein [Alphaproteobacteria bacterium]